MDPLTLIGLLLFFGGLMIFSFKLSQYNRRKFDPDSPAQTQSKSRSTLQLLSMIILALALVIYFLFRV